MNVYITSNGATVRRSAGSGSLEVVSDFCFDLLPTVHEEALREFFRAEEDERLGRWRWPENPEWIVYPDGTGEVGSRHVITIWEVNGRRDSLYEGGVPNTVYGAAARAYFDAHPEPKPWHNAKPGEVWVLDANEFSGPNYVEASGHFTGGVGFRHVITRDHGPGVIAPYIKSAHRIYPEGDS